MREDAELLFMGAEGGQVSNLQSNSHAIWMEVLLINELMITLEIYIVLLYLQLNGRVFDKTVGNSAWKLFFLY